MATLSLMSHFCSWPSIGFFLQPPGSPGDVALVINLVLLGFGELRIDYGVDQKS